MRQLGLFLTFLALVLTISSCSCSKTDDPEQYEFGFQGGESIAFPPSGGYSQLMLEAPAAWTLKVPDDARWLEVSPDSGSAGKHQLMLAASSNITYDERATKVLVTCAGVSLSLTVTQSSNTGFILTQHSLSVGSEGATMSVEIRSNIDFTVSTDEDWISVELPTRALSTSAVALTVAPNASVEKRSGKVIFKSEGAEDVLTVTQNGDEQKAAIYARETEIMHELYRALSLNDTDFENNPWYGWNWSLDRPIEEWYMVEMENGRVTSIVCPYYAKSNLGDRIYYKGYIPDCIGELSELRVFATNCNLMGWSRPITPAFGKLTKLEELKIDGLNIPGGIPEEIWQLSSLRRLTLINTPTGIDYTGTGIGNPFEMADIPEEIGNLSNLEYLDFRWRTENTLPKAIGQLKKLKELYFYVPYYYETDGSYAGILEQKPLGPIPDEIGGLQDLEVISLLAAFSGDIPAYISGMKKLRDLRLSSAYLTGGLPESIGQLSNLESIDIVARNMTGGIPESIGLLSQLAYLSLGDSGFGGPLPESLGQCKKLHALDISYCNFTSFPGSLSFMLDNKNNSSLNNDVGLFRLNDNAMTGSIPEAILHHPNFYLFATNFLIRQKRGYGFDLDGFRYPACKERYVDCFTGQNIDFAREYAGHRYTLVLRHNMHADSGNLRYCAEMVNRLQDKYADKGLAVFCGLINDPREDWQLRNDLNPLNLTRFPTFHDNMGWGYDQNTAFFNDYNGITGGCDRTPLTLCLIDQEGYYVYMSGGLSMTAYDSRYLKGHYLPLKDFESAVEALFSQE